MPYSLIIWIKVSGMGNMSLLNFVSTVLKSTNISLVVIYLKYVIKTFNFTRFIFFHIVLGVRIITLHNIIMRRVITVIFLQHICVVPHWPTANPGSLFMVCTNSAPLLYTTQLGSIWESPSGSKTTVWYVRKSVVNILELLGQLSKWFGTLS